MKKVAFLPAMCVTLLLLIAGCARNGPAPPDGASGPSDGPTESAGFSAPSGVDANSEPESTVPEETEPEGTAPESQAPGTEQGSTGNTAPEGTDPSSTAPGSAAPDSSAPADIPPADPGERTGAARPSNAGALRVSGTDLVGSDGKKVQLRGISTHGLAWYPDYVNSRLFHELSEDWGVNAVRLAMYTAEYGGYCSGGDREALYKLVTDGARWAKDSDMYVIIDWHILSDSDPNTHADDAAEFFGRVSRELGKMDNVLYEICNEPNGSTGWEDVKRYAERLIPVIRQNDPDAVILVGTPQWCQRVDLAARDPITGYDNIMYTLHFYAATHKGELRERMERAAGDGLPIFVSEFGICDASGNGAVDTAEADKWVKAMDELGVSYVMWSLSNKAESASAIASSCQKTSGFSSSDLTDTGRWLLKILSGTPSEAQTPDKPAVAPTETAPPETTPPETAPGSQTPPSGDEGRFEWTLEMVNSWQGGDGEYRQYSLTVKNTGGDAESWSVDIPVEGEIVNSWNGNFSKSAGGYTVTGLDYNSALPSGAAARDIGFIVRK